MEDLNLRLRVVAEAGDIDGFYALLQQDPNILKGAYDDVPFVDTPLHLAAGAGHTRFGIEMLNLKPSFGRKLNQQGLSPLHMAIREGHAETAKRLIEADPELVRVKGREGKTALHCAAEVNNADIVAEILFACPASLTDVTVRKQMAIHLAVQKGNVEALRVLLGWERRIRKTYMGWQDDEGNTVYHMAASTDQLQVMDLLLQRRQKRRRHINDKNMNGLTALDIAYGLPPVATAGSSNQSPIIGVLVRAGALRAAAMPVAVGTPSASHKFTTLANFISSPLQLGEMILYIRKRNQSSDPDYNAFLVVAVLIITITYQGVLSPPGGLLQQADNTITTSIPSTHQNFSFSPSPSPSPTTNTTADDHELRLRAGLAVMQPRTIFTYFLYFNTVAFFAAVITTSSINRLFSTKQTKFLLNFSLATLMVSYLLAFVIISNPHVGTSFWVTPLLVVFCYLEFGMVDVLESLIPILSSDGRRVQKQRQILSRANY